MTRTTTPPELLMDCLYDLWDGERLLCARLETIREHAADPGLAACLVEIRSQAECDMATLKEAIRGLDVPEPDTPNIWMEGILNDARRDTQSIARGPLLDAAIVGAVRKALVAAKVSYETAIAVAQNQGLWDTALMLFRLCAARQDRDDELSELLARLAAIP